MQMFELTPQWRAILSQESAETFEERYPNLLVCFDTGAVFSALANYFKLEGLPLSVTNDFSLDTLLKSTEQVFLILLKRGALNSLIRVNPLPEAAQQELDRMAGVIPAPVDSQAAEREAEAERIRECVFDYHTLEGGKFQLRWMSNPSRRAIYERAIAQGSI